MSTSRRESALLALAFAALQLPFLGQALVIDDGNFVDQALQILQNPGQPYSFTVDFNQPFDFFYYFANPPGLAYFFAGVIAAFGSSELALHAASLLFGAAAIVAMVGLSDRLAARGVLGASLLLTTPAFLVSSHTLMADVPACALYLACIYCFVRGTDEGKTNWVLLAGALGGGAALLKYSSLSVIVLLALYGLLRWRAGLGGRPLLHAGLAITTALAVFGAWCVASQLVYGEIHFLAAGALENRSLPVAAQVQQAFAALADLGGATLFAPVLLVWALTASFALARSAGVASVAAAICVAAIALLPTPGFLQVWEEPGNGYGLLNRSLLALLLATGAATVSFAAASGIAALRALIVKEEDSQALGEAAITVLLVAWLLGFVWLDARLLFATPKYLVPAVAPLILLLLRARCERCSSPAWFGGALGSTVLLALALSVSSASNGGSQRRFVQETVPEIAPGQNIWFTGHHAIRYYADKQGQSPLPERLAAHATPRVGDIVYVVRGASKHGVPTELRPRLEPIAEVSSSSPIPLVMNNLRMGAGYWAHGAVPLPYAVSTDPQLRLLVFRLEP